MFKQMRERRAIRRSNELWIQSFHKGYAAGHADGSAEVSRCRGPLHAHPSQAPIATWCPTCYVLRSSDARID
jgi:hypothetical protein